jgi:dTDP-4-dehydrorhamnose 3,5-epimerase
MEFIETPLKGSYVVELAPFRDERGLFARTFCKKEFKKINHGKEFVQINHSATLQKGSIRGLHYQVPPGCEIKLIRCVKGKVFDVIVDIRNDSSTFLDYFAVELSEQNMKMIYVPEGFAHGFQTLAPNSQLIYHHSNYYSPADERAIRYDDPLIGIKWPLKPSVVSQKDQSYDLLDHQFAGITL